MLGKGHSVTVMTRNRAKAVRKFKGGINIIEHLDELRSTPDVIVNLAGSSLGRGRWTSRRKHAFIASRVDTTRAMISHFQASQTKPRVFLSGSAVGFYGECGDEVLVEYDSVGNEFQADLCKAWEQEALKAEEQGIRVCLLRMGVVLGADGGVLRSMLPWFRMGLGGYLAGGDQWISWIHIDDLLSIIEYLIMHDTLLGAFNVTSPNPVTNRMFALTLGESLDRPVWIRIPAWSVMVSMGEMGRLLLTGQKVIPAKLMHCGYKFEYPDLSQAMQQIVEQYKS